MILRTTKLSNSESSPETLLDVGRACQGARQYDAESMDIVKARAEWHETGGVSKRAFRKSVRVRQNKHSVGSCLKREGNHEYVR